MIARRTRATAHRPLHLAGHLARARDRGLRRQPRARRAAARVDNLVVWLVAGAVLHDLVLLPAATRRSTRGAASRARAARGAGDQPPARPGGDLAACCCSSASRSSSCSADGNYVRATGHHVAGYAGALAGDHRRAVPRFRRCVYLVPRQGVDELEHPVRPAGDEDVRPCARRRPPSPAGARSGQRAQHVRAPMSGELDELVARRKRDRAGGGRGRARCRTARRAGSSGATSSTPAPTEKTSSASPWVSTHVARPALQARDVGRAEPGRGARRCAAACARRRARARARERRRRRPVARRQARRRRRAASPPSPWP